MFWRGIVKSSHNMGEGRLWRKISAPNPLMTAHRLTPLSARSISVVNKEKKIYEKVKLMRNRNFSVEGLKNIGKSKITRDLEKHLSVEKLIVARDEIPPVVTVQELSLLLPCLGHCTRTNLGQHSRSSKQEVKLSQLYNMSIL
jgi:hypothetical protein